MKTYDFTETAKWLDDFPTDCMAQSLKEGAFNLVALGLKKDDGIDPKEHVLNMMDAVNFVCGFLDTIKVRNTPRN